MSGSNLFSFASKVSRRTLAEIIAKSKYYELLNFLGNLVSFIRFDFLLYSCVSYFFFQYHNFVLVLVVYKVRKFFMCHEGFVLTHMHFG